MPVDENNPNLERGEFRIIQQLVKYLPGGKKIKQEVCWVIRKVAMFCLQWTSSDNKSDNKTDKSVIQRRQK